VLRGCLVVLSFPCIIIIVLSIVSSIFVPNFTRVENVKIAEVKDTLATIITPNHLKECMAYVKEEAYLPATRDITVDDGKLTVYTLSVGPTCFTATAKPNDVKFPELSISYNNETGTTTKTCIAGEYPYGCFAGKDLTIEQEPGMPGYW